MDSLLSITAITHIVSHLTHHTPLQCHSDYMYRTSRLYLSLLSRPYISLQWHVHGSTGVRQGRGHHGREWMGRQVSLSNCMPPSFHFDREHTTLVHSLQTPRPGAWAGQVSDRDAAQVCTLPHETGTGVQCLPGSLPVSVCFLVYQARPLSHCVGSCGWS